MLETDGEIVFILSSERYFISVCCFLTFNINDWLGRTVTTLIRWVRSVSPAATKTEKSISLQQSIKSVVHTGMFVLVLTVQSLTNIISFLLLSSAAS